MGNWERSIGMNDPAFLHGLMRVRGFTQDDAHIFCRPDQLGEEVQKVLKFITSMLGTFGFTEFKMFLSTRPEKAVGTIDQWDQATLALEAALKDGGYSYQEDPGEGVFYGPKIDVKIQDALGRSWQCSTVQVDFNNPETIRTDLRGRGWKNSSTHHDSPGLTGFD